jgi:hypothetical protein
MLEGKLTTLIRIGTASRGCFDFFAAMLAVLCQQDEENL